MASLFSQTFVDYEYVVVDGHSTDGTLDALNRCRDKIDILISEQDNGIYDAMNKGINLVKGEYIYFLNAGDTFYEPATLEKVAASLTENPGDLLYGDIALIDETGSTLKIKSHALINNVKSFFYRTITHQSVFARAALFRKIGLFDLDYSIYADYDWLIKCFKNPAVTRIYLPLIIAEYLTGGVSQQNKDQRKQEKQRLFQRSLSSHPHYLFFLLKMKLGKLLTKYGFFKLNV